MIWKDGYCRPSGSSDFEDSSHLAGMLAVIGHEEAPSFGRYIFVNPTTRQVHYQRCPNSQYDFSRDQFTCLAAGMIAHRDFDYIKKEYITGRDILPPSVRGLFRVAQGLKPALLQRLWLRAEILFHAYCNPLGEPNQIIALCSVYGPEYMRFWTKRNKQWDRSIIEYWAGWRGEKELSDRIIDFVNGEIK